MAGGCRGPHFRPVRKLSVNCLTIFVKMQNLGLKTSILKKFESKLKILSEICSDCR